MFMNKKILVSLSVIGAVAAIVIGGTAAWFSNTETSTGNVLTAGTIDLEVNSQNPWTQSGQLTDIKPSQDLTPITVTFKNVGSIAGILTFNVEITGEADKTTVLYGKGKGSDEDTEDMDADGFASLI